MKKVFAVFFAVSMLAAVALANEGHGGGPIGPGAAFAGPEGGLTVGSDGTVYLTSTTVANNVATTTIKAVRSTGTVAWTATITGRGHFTLSGSNLLTVSEPAPASGETVTSTITAISTLSGATAWTRTITGRVGQLHPFSGGTYAEVIVPAATSGGTATRSLVAIGNDGAVLWTLAI